MEIDRYLCIVDLEATCWENRRNPGPGGQGYVQPRMEIIEIGAVMVDSDSMTMISEFQSFVKPKLNPILSDFCKNLTSITQDNVDRAEHYPEVLKRFRAWYLEFGKPTFCSWGYYDRNQFLLDCELHGEAYPFIGDHLNIKDFVAVKMGWSKKGVRKALDRFGMTFEGTAHRGIDDARNIFRILKKAGL